MIWTKCTFWFGELILVFSLSYILRDTRFESWHKVAISTVFGFFYAGAFHEVLNFLKRNFK